MSLPGGQNFWKLASSTGGLLALLYIGIVHSVDPDRFVERFVHSGNVVLFSSYAS